MTVLVIRAHKRFAVCRKARLGGTVRGKALLIELSLDGCRIGNVDTSRCQPNDRLTIYPDGGEPFEAAVRWIGDGSLGLRLVRPFHIPELDRLIRTCRGEFDRDAALAYGT